MRIKVLGGGVAGLAAAYRLGGEHDVVVCEARSRAGGNIRTERVEGCLVEWGPNGFLDNEPATLRLVRELGLEGRLAPARACASLRFIWRAGKLRALPDSPWKFLTGDLLPLRSRLRALLMPFTRARAGRDETIHEFAARRLGQGVAGILVDAFVSGVFAGDPKRLSLRSALPRIANARGLPKAPRAVLTSFDGGLQVLIDALAGRVDLRLGQQAASLEREDFDHVLCTVPAPRAAALARGDLAQLLGRIPMAPVAVVATIFKRSLELPEAFGFLVPRGQGLRMLGTLYDSSIFEGRAPEGLRLFRTMLGGRRDPEVLQLSDGELVDLVARELRQVWGRFPDPLATRVIRHPLGIAQYERGHAELLAAIERACPEWLRLAGSSYRGVSINACIKEVLDWAP